LAAGMLKALEVLKESKRRDLSTIPVMVIITDGEANVPLRKDLFTGDIREFDPVDVAFFKYEDQAIKDVISISEITKKENIHTVVINTNPSLTDSSANSGSITTKMITSITNGVHYEVPRSIFERRQKPADKISEVILQAQRHFSHFNYLTSKARAKQ